MKSHTDIIEGELLFPLTVVTEILCDEIYHFILKLAGFHFRFPRVHFAFVSRFIKNESKRQKTLRKIDFSSLLLPTIFFFKFE